MTFYNIENLDSFFEEIDSCDGGVMLQTGEGESVDLRHNALAQTLLRTTGSRCGLDRLDVKIERPADTVKLMKYMMEGSWDKRDEMVVA